MSTSLKLLALSVFLLYHIIGQLRKRLPRTSQPAVFASKSTENKVASKASCIPDVARPTLRSQQKVPRLSLPSSALKSAYDVVVIGSGYGSGAAASRFARAGKSVCVLERGAEKWPGEYPHTAAGALREYEVSGQASGRVVRVGRQAGQYQTIKGDGQDVFVGCGLGGTSLINAGVWLRADKRVLSDPAWPIEISEGGLDGYYARAEQMFQPTSYPSTYSTPAKLAALETEACSLGLQAAFYRPPLTISFRDELNRAGVRMQASIGSGNECSGTNDGSKNSVLVTYLVDAWARGAELFCGIDVKYVRKREHEGGHVIFYETSSANGAKRLSWVIAKELVILGAGAIGTPSILLRSRLHGLSTSPLLGQRISGNGDMLSFAYNCNQELNSVGRDKSSHCGPTITGCVDLRAPVHTVDSVRNGFIIQDGAMPEVLAPIIQTLLETHTVGPPSRLYIGFRGMLARMKSWIFGPYTKHGSVNRTMVFLTMSHDEDQAILTLEDDEIVLKWEGASKKRTAQVDSILNKMVENLGGMLVKSPLMTVHPLGGAVMSSDGTGLGGVVNHRSELFTESGEEVHDGLVCVDGSIVPTSLGVNPCATICALAERTCDMTMKERGWEVDESPNGELNLYGEPPYSQDLGKLARPDDGASRDIFDGVQFEEMMHGYVYIGSDITDFVTAERVARAASSSARLTLTVDARRTDEDAYLGFAEGIFSCGALSPDPLLITSGSVDFFSTDEDVADAVRFVYKLELLSTAGTTYTLHGFKQIDSSITLSVGRTWRATTTLFTTITGSDGVMVGRGIIHLRFRAFVSEIRSLNALDRGEGRLQNLLSITEFVSFFAQNISSYFFSPFRPLQHPTPSTDSKGFFKKPNPTTVTLTASDGIYIPLRSWHPRPNTLRKTTTIILIPGASVDNQIFSLPTVPTNTIDYLTGLGYMCYVPVLRFGMGENGKYGYTAFDARLDVAAAVKYVFEKEETKVYVIAHCLGSIALGMGLLNGDVDTKWIKGMTVSQVFMDIIFSPDNLFKARRPWLIKGYETLSRSPWFPLSSPFPSSISWLDTLLRFYPVGSRAESCKSATCHRCLVPFGRCWTHANLNHATHKYLDRFFDGIHTNFMSHLSGMGAASPEHLLSNSPESEDLVSKENLKRFEDLKIQFLYGGDNAVWSSRATKSSYDRLRDCFPGGVYERVIVEGYGHLDCWMGKDAWRDVWPRVARWVEICEETEESNDKGGDEWVNIGSEKATRGI